MPSRLSKHNLYAPKTISRRGNVGIINRIKRTLGFIEPNKYSKDDNDTPRERINSIAKNQSHSLHRTMKKLSVRRKDNGKYISFS